MIKANAKVGVVGSGSWGTAIVKMLCENLNEVHWWVHNEYVKGFIEKNEHNPDYISSAEFDVKKLKLTTDINRLVEKCDVIFLVVPSIYFLSTIKDLKKPIDSKFIISAIKGLVPENLKSIGEYLNENCKVSFENIGVVSGPCHAEEVALERLSFLTISAVKEQDAKAISNLLECQYIKTKISNDIHGTEYASIIKNIYAIAAGIAHGLGYGDNFQAVLMSNAVREMSAVVGAISPIERNIDESAYLGDLLVTGYSFFSRNRMFGNMIGKGYTVKSAIMEMTMVAEGYYATQGLYDLKEKYDLKIPIISAVHKILYRGKNPRKVMKSLSDKLN